MQLSSRRSHDRFRYCLEAGGPRHRRPFPLSPPERPGCQVCPNTSLAQRCVGAAGCPAAGCVRLPALVQNLGFSFLKWDIYSGRQTFVGADNYVRMFNDPIFWKSLLNNTLYAIISIAFQVFGGAMILAAMIEGLRSQRWRGILRAVYFVPSAISLTVAGLLFYFIYEPEMGILNASLDFLGLGNFTQAWLGQENTAIFAIIAMSQWQGFGYCTLLFSVALQRIPLGAV